jgi:uncharacterized protein YuzE
VVVFDSGTCLHLALGRPDLMDEADLILGTVPRPDHRANDPIPGREHFYRRDLDPRRWLRVVVHFNDEPACRDRSGPREPATRLEAMTITIAGIPFDHHHYDERGDVLYLNVGEPRSAARGLETPDGHAIHYDDESGAVTGLTLLNVRHTLERDGRLTLTLPPEHLEANALQPILAAA